MSDFAPLEPHGPLVALTDDLWYLTGSVKMAPLVRIPRNMVVVRHEGALTIVDSVRLSDAGAAELDALGEVTNVVKIGTHAMDDAWYLDRYGAKYWALAGARLPTGLSADVAMTEDTALPIPDASLFVFTHTKAPEAAILFARDGGWLLTCDSVQHWVDTKGCSLMAKIASHAMGFMKPAQIGPPWRKAMTPEGGSLRPDFERLAELPFDKLLGAHGAPLRGGAKARLRETIARVFG